MSHHPGHPAARRVSPPAGGAGAAPAGTVGAARVGTVGAAPAGTVGYAQLWSADPGAWATAGAAWRGLTGPVRRRADALDARAAASAPPGPARPATRRGSGSPRCAPS